MRSLLKNNIIQELEQTYSEFIEGLEELNDFSTRIETLMVIGVELNRVDGIFRLITNDNEKIDLTKDKFGILPFDKSYLYETKLSKQLIISYCSIFEDYILSIIMKLYLNSPDKILTKDKKSNQEQVITYDKLLGYDTLEEIIIDKIQEKVAKLTYESKAKNFDKIKLFCNNFYIDDDLKNKISDIYVIRNTVVHNKGIVNQQFLNSIRSNNNYKLGDKIELKLSDFDGRVGNEGIINLFHNTAKIIYDFLICNIKSS